MMLGAKLARQAIKRRGDGLVMIRQAVGGLQSASAYGSTRALNVYARPGWRELKRRERRAPVPASLPFEQPFNGVLDGEQVRGFGDQDINGGAIAGGMSGAHHHRGGRGTQLDDVGHFHAGHARHGIIGEHQIVEQGIETRQGLARGIRRVHLVAEVVQEHLRQKTRIIIIIYYQHGPRLDLQILLHCSFVNVHKWAQLVRFAYGIPLIAMLMAKSLLAALA